LHLHYWHLNIISDKGKKKFCQHDRQIERLMTWLLNFILSLSSQSDTHIFSPCLLAKWSQQWLYFIMAQGYKIVFMCNFCISAILSTSTLVNVYTHTHTHIYTHTRIHISGWNLGRVFKSRLSCVCIGHVLYTFCKIA